MQGIGERLEEARKRKGISLREAAEATKIRGDFLGNFENNKFDFSLPDIYKRGFIKNYARYLKLDAEKLITDYDAYQLSHARTTKKGAGEWFGHMDIKQPKGAEHPSEREKAEPARDSSGTMGTMSAPAPRQASESGEQGEDADKMLYLKVGLVFVGTLALVVVVFSLIRAILGGGSDAAEGPELREPAAVRSTVAANTVAGDDVVTLTASGSVYVLVKQRDDDAILFRDTMTAGQVVPVSKSGPVDILFTAGENLIIEHAGEKLRPSSSGTAKITLP